LIPGFSVPSNYRQHSLADMLAASATQNPYLIQCVIISS
jgi:hypothetical protein